jgi:hypothetical protein
MIGYMTETPERPNEPTTKAAEPPSRWDNSHRPGRIYRLAAFVVVLAGIVFILAVIFWSGFLLGASAGGHHGDGGGGSRHENGMVHHGLSMERTVPSVAVTT